MPLSNMTMIPLWHGSFVSDPRIRPSQPLKSSSPMSEHNIMLLSRAGDLMLAANLCMSKAFRYYLKDNGIHIHQSMPYTHQQNGHTKRLIWTLMDKAQAMRLHTCLSDSYWEFTILHAAHVYNMMPMN